MSKQQPIRHEQRQSKLDSVPAPVVTLVNVKCVRNKCHTSAGRLLLGQTQKLPQAEADELLSTGDVEIIDL